MNHKILYFGQYTPRSLYIRCNYKDINYRKLYGKKLINIGARWHSKMKNGGDLGWLIPVENKQKLIKIIETLSLPDTNKDTGKKLDNSPAKPDPPLKLGSCHSSSDSENEIVEIDDHTSFLINRWKEETNNPSKNCIVASSPSSSQYSVSSSSIDQKDTNNPSTNCIVASSPSSSQYSVSSSSIDQKYTNNPSTNCIVASSPSSSQYSVSPSKPDQKEINKTSPSSSQYSVSSSKPDQKEINKTFPKPPTKYSISPRSKHNSCSRKSNSNRNSDIINYYKAFSQKPKKFREIYSYSSSSSEAGSDDDNSYDDDRLSSSSYESSSDDFPYAKSPERAKLADNSEFNNLLSEVSSIQKRLDKFKYQF